MISNAKLSSSPPLCPSTRKAVPYQNICTIFANDKKHSVFGIGIPSSVHRQVISKNECEDCIEEICKSLNYEYNLIKSEDLGLLLESFSNTVLRPKLIENAFTSTQNTQLSKQLKQLSRLLSNLDLNSYQSMSELKTDYTVFHYPRNFNDINRFRTNNAWARYFNNVSILLQRSYKSLKSDLLHAQPLLKTNEETPTPRSSNDQILSKEIAELETSVNAQLIQTKAALFCIEDQKENFSSQSRQYSEKLQELNYQLEKQSIEIAKLKTQVLNIRADKILSEEENERIKEDLIQFKLQIDTQANSLDTLLQALANTFDSLDSKLLALEVSHQKTAATAKAEQKVLQEALRQQEQYQEDKIASLKQETQFARTTLSSELKTEESLYPERERQDIEKKILKEELGAELQEVSTQAAFNAIAIQTIQVSLQECETECLEASKMQSSNACFQALQDELFKLFPKTDEQLKAELQACVSTLQIRGLSLPSPAPNHEKEFEAFFTQKLKEFQETSQLVLNIFKETRSLDKLMPSIEAFTKVYSVLKRDLPRFDHSEASQMASMLDDFHKKLEKTFNETVSGILQSAVVCQDIQCNIEIETELAQFEENLNATSMHPKHPHLFNLKDKDLDFDASNIFKLACDELETQHEELEASINNTLIILQGEKSRLSQLSQFLGVGNEKFKIQYDNLNKAISDLQANGSELVKLKERLSVFQKIAKATQSFDEHYTATSLFQDLDTYEYSFSEDYLLSVAKSFIETWLPRKITTASQEDLKKVFTLSQNLYIALDEFLERTKDLEVKESSPWRLAAAIFSTYLKSVTNCKKKFNEFREDQIQADSFYPVGQEDIFSHPLHTTFQNSAIYTVLKEAENLEDMLNGDLLWSFYTNDSAKKTIKKTIEDISLADLFTATKNLYNRDPFKALIFVSSCCIYYEKELTSIEDTSSENFKKTENRLLRLLDLHHHLNKSLKIFSQRDRKNDKYFSNGTSARFASDSRSIETVGSNITHMWSYFIEQKGKKQPFASQLLLSDKIVSSLTAELSTYVGRTGSGKTTALGMLQTLYGKAKSQLLLTSPVGDEAFELNTIATYQKFVKFMFMSNQKRFEAMQLDGSSPKQEETLYIGFDENLCHDIDLEDFINMVSDELKSFDTLDDKFKEAFKAELKTLIEQEPGLPNMLNCSKLLSQMIQKHKQTLQLQHDTAIFCLSATVDQTIAIQQAPLLCLLADPNASEQGDFYPLYNECLKISEFDLRHANIDGFKEKVAILNQAYKTAESLLKKYYDDKTKRTWLSQLCSEIQSIVDSFERLYHAFHTGEFLISSTSSALEEALKKAANSEHRIRAFWNCDQEDIQHYFGETIHNCTPCYDSVPEESLNVKEKETLCCLIAENPEDPEFIYQVFSKNENGKITPLISFKSQEKLNQFLEINKDNPSKIDILTKGPQFSVGQSIGLTHSDHFAAVLNACTKNHSSNSLTYIDPQLLVQIIGRSRFTQKTAAFSPDRWSTPIFVFKHNEDVSKDSFIQSTLSQITHSVSFSERVPQYTIRSLKAFMHTTLAMLRGNELSNTITQSFIQLLNEPETTVDLSKLIQAIQALPCGMPEIEESIKTLFELINLLKLFQSQLSGLLDADRKEDFNQYINSLKACFENLSSNFQNLDEWINRYESSRDAFKEFTEFLKDPNLREKFQRWKSQNPDKELKEFAKGLSNETHELHYKSELNLKEFILKGKFKSDCPEDIVTQDRVRETAAKFGHVRLVTRKAAERNTKKSWEDFMQIFKGLKMVEQWTTIDSVNKSSIQIFSESFKKASTYLENSSALIHKLLSLKVQESERLHKNVKSDEITRGGSPISVVDATSEPGGSSFTCDSSNTTVNGAAVRARKSNQGLSI